LNIASLINAGKTNVQAPTPVNTYTHQAVGIFGSRYHGVAVASATCGCGFFDILSTTENDVEIMPKTRPAKPNRIKQICDQFIVVSCDQNLEQASEIKQDDKKERRI
jgi:hypothetical protein